MKMLNKSKHSLGELEAEVMEIIWGLKNASVREVLDKLKKGRKIAYTTVMTVMTRLNSKGILNREFGASGAYVYKPFQDREDFLASASKRAVNNLIIEFGEVAVAQFVDFMENGNLKNLEKWRKKLQKIK